MTSLVQTSAKIAISCALVFGTLSVGSAANSQRVVNITSDSQQGWIPSEELERQAQETLAEYFSFVDSGSHRRAYEMLSDGHKALMSFNKFQEMAVKFRKDAGSLTQRRIVKINWTKGSSIAPDLGTYVAVDFAAKYTLINRDCGYVILRQSPLGGPFQVARVEDNYITNKSAETIERENSRAYLDQTWAALSTNCPNFAPEMPR